MRERSGRSVGAVVADKGFASTENSRVLEQLETFEGTCPRQPEELKRKMKNPKFARMQRRRAQTEGRIGFIKLGFLGYPMSAKGFEHRELAVAWSVSTHNLWMLARMSKTQRRKKAESPAQGGVEHQEDLRRTCATEEMSPEAG